MSIPVSHVADSVRHSASDAFSLFGLGEGAARVKYAGGLQKKKSTQSVWIHRTITFTIFTMEQGADRLKTAQCHF